MDREKLLTPRPELSEDPALPSPLTDDEVVGKPGEYRVLAITSLLWDQRRFLFRVFWRGLLICALVVFLIPNRYESTARIMPPDNQASAGMSMLLSLIGSNSGDAGGAGLGGAVANALGIKASGDLFVGIMQSERVEQRLVDRFDLRKVYGEEYNVEARKKLRKKTTIDQDRRSGIISITVEDRDPRRAADMARAYVDELNHTVADVATSSARRERIFLEERLKTVKQELHSAAVAFSEFASKNTAIDIPQQGKSMVEAAARLQGELIAAQSELKGLEQIYTPNNVRVRSVKARVGELQRELNKLGGADNNGESPSLYPSIRQLPLLGVKYADLYRQTKIEEAIYAFLTKQYEMAKVEEAKEIPTVRVLDQPLVPERKAFPPRLLLIALGALLSLMCGCCWIVGGQIWRSVPSHNPWKLLASQVADSTRPIADSRITRAVRRTRGSLRRFRGKVHLGRNGAKDDLATQGDPSNERDQLDQ